MNSNCIEDFVKIREAAQNNRLVIFVGAGVSKNAGLPTWKELIIKIADKINYFEDMSEEERIKKIKYLSSDEYLKIPQFLFDKNKDDYFRLLDEYLNTSAKPTSLNSKILEILPDHIITTNYDQLFEDTNELNLSQYQIVSSDKDLLTKQGEHYLIKMHGDIIDTSTIILKEDDYLNYTNNHILIETFIKSLLVDHVFLFVGYSLNDYNFKQIMSWIDFLSTKEDVKKYRHKNYIINPLTPKDYEIRYWENKNLKIINSLKLDTSLIDKYSNQANLGIDNKIGNSLYACLEIIHNEESDIDLMNYEDFILDRLRIFDPVNFIYLDDLLKIVGLSRTDFSSGCLLFCEEDTFEKWAELVKNKKITSYLNKAGISSIDIFNDRREIQIDKDTDNPTDKLLDYEISFKYYKLLPLAKKYTENINVKYNYYYLIYSDYSKIQNEYENAMNNLTSKWDIAIYKFNVFLMKKNNILFYSSKEVKKTEINRYISMFSSLENKAFCYLLTIINDGSDFKMINNSYDLLDKTRRTYNNPPFLSTDFYGELTTLQDKAYLHFYFIKNNGIAIDLFNDTIRSFESFIKACLIARKSIKKTKTFDGIQTIKNYSLKDLDIYIFVMYTNYKKINEFISDQGINNILDSENTKVEELFENFCKSIIFSLQNENIFLVQRFPVFSLLLRNSDLSKKQLQSINNSLKLLLNDSIFSSRLGSNDISRELLLLLIHLAENKIKIDAQLISQVIKFLPVKEFHSNLWIKLTFSLENMKYITSERTVQIAINRRFQEINREKEKVNFIANQYFIMSNYLKNKHLPYLRKNLKLIDENILVILLVNKVLEFDQASTERYLDELKTNIENTRQGINILTNSPDRSIDNFLLLHLFDFTNNLDFLKPYQEYSAKLEFIFNPQTFDYSKIDYDDPMWENLFQNDKYRDTMIKYGKDAIKKDIQKELRKGTATESQKKLFYRYILSDDEVWYS